MNWELAEEIANLILFLLIMNYLDIKGTLIMAQIDTLRAAIAGLDAQIKAVLAAFAAAQANPGPDLSGIIADVQANTAALSAALSPMATSTTASTSATATATLVNSASPSV